MNKKGLTDFVAEDLGLSKSRAKEAVESVIAGIADGVQQDDKVALVGFGSFNASLRKERKGRNPSTGEEITIPAKRVVKFKPSKVLADFIAEG